MPGSLVRRAIGVWLDGAEPSACIQVPGEGTTLDDLQYVAALLGVRFLQKDALVFLADHLGPDQMHSFTVVAELSDVDMLVRSAGIEHRSYVLGFDSVHTVYVFDNGFDSDLQAKLDGIGERYGYVIETQNGTGDFVTGFAESRQQGKDVFLQLISEYERRHPAHRRFIG